MSLRPSGVNVRAESGLTRAASVTPRAPRKTISDSQRPTLLEYRYQHDQQGDVDHEGSEHHVSHLPRPGGPDKHTVHLEGERAGEGRQGGEGQIGGGFRAHRLSLSSSAR